MGPSEMKHLRAQQPPLEKPTGVDHRVDRMTTFVASRGDVMCFIPSTF